MQQLLVVLFLGLAASAYGLDLTHAARSTPIEPRIFNHLSDLYKQVIFPPLNLMVTSLAGFSAQLLAGISATGLPMPDGRMMQPSEAQVRGIFDDIWNNAVRPQVEQLLSGLSLTAAGALANLGVNGINLNNIFGGKSDLIEMRGGVDDFFLNLFTGIFQKPLEQALSTTALLGAQVLAGIGTNGIDLASLIGKRDVTEVQMRGIEDFFGQLFSSIFQKPIEQALSTGALLGAQVLAGMGTNGIDLSSIFGRSDLGDFAGRQAELRGLFDVFGDAVMGALQHVWTNVLQGPLQGALQTGALLGAQVLAGMGTNGINLSSIGKRDLTAEQRGFFDFIDNMVNHGTNLVNTHVKPMVETLLSGAALQLAGVLANFSQTGTIGRR